MTIIVADTEPDFRVWIGSTNVFAGETGRVPIWLDSGAMLTDLNLRLVLPSGLLRASRLTSITAGAGSGGMTPTGDDGLILQFVGRPGTASSGTEQLALLEFATLPGQDSMRAQIHVPSAWAFAADGRSLKGRGGSAPVVILGETPLLELSDRTTVDAQLSIYARPDATVLIERSAGNLIEPAWIRHASVTVTNLPTLILVPIDAPGAHFYRARQ